MNTARQLISLLKSKELTIASAESCTGGLFAAALVDIPGASDVFIEGLVCYSNASKISRLGVCNETLHLHGAVSKETAAEMACGIKTADVAVSITGIAGPGGGTDEKPLGLVYIGISYKSNLSVKEYHFTGTRLEIRKKSVQAAFEDVLRLLL